MPVYTEGTITDQFGNTIPRVVFGGGDYIERNALNLVAYIRWLNTQLPAGQTIALVGPSMGGQISRYALNYMEKRGEQHNVRLWISMDSPHDGANIPIGAQTMLDVLADQDAQAETFKIKFLGSPAAKQQLIHHYLANSEVPTGAPGFFERYYKEQNDMGWPSQCRKIAMVSGAIDGTSHQYATGCSNVLDADVNINVFSLFELTVATFRGYFAPNGSNSRCLVSRVFLTDKVDWQHISTTHEFPYYAYGFDKSENSIDAIPGGQFDAYGLIAQALQSSSSIPGWLSLNNLVNYHSFIPTASAIALNNGTFQQYQGKWDDDLRPLMYKCQPYSPFDYYMGPVGKNYKHDELFEEQANEIIEEINGSYHFFPKLQQTLTIVDNNYDVKWCPNTTKQFSFQINENLQNVIWSVNNSAYLQIVGGQGTNTVTILYVGGSGVDIIPTVSVHVEGNCKKYDGNLFNSPVYYAGDFNVSINRHWRGEYIQNGTSPYGTFQPNDHISLPSPYAFVTVSSLFVPKNSVNFNYLGSSGTLNGWTQYTTTNGTKELAASGITTSPNQHFFSIDYNHLCAGVQHENFSITFVHSKLGRIITYTKDNSFIYLNLNEPNMNKTSASLKYSVEWYDLTGRLLNKSFSTKEIQTIKSTIPALPKGIYIIKITGANLNESIKIVL